jgi:hypothetical protein
MVNGRTVAEDMERECHLSALRDTFAAAALTGLIAAGDYSVESTPTLAFRMADAMLRERLRNGVPDGCETVQPDHFPDAGKMVHTLTDAERRAVAWAANVTDDWWPGSHAKQMIGTLRGLLERTK